MNKKLPVSVSLAITIIAMTVTFSITWLVSMARFDETVSSVTQLQTQYSKLGEIDNYVRNNFFGEIDDNTLFDQVAKGYINGLGDRYSVYYSEAEYTELLAIENGTLLGVGLEIYRDGDGSFYIAYVHPSSPAARAGVRENGRILTVDGQSAKDITSVRAMHGLLRGAEGSELSLTVAYGITEEEAFTIQRIKYTAPTVRAITVNDYSYIRISSFTTATFAELEYEVRMARSRQVKGLVFDVRANSGGRFSYTYEAIDMLCPIGTIAKSEAKNGTMRVLATSDENAVDLPMVVLVDSGTSAAAELFAVSLRDLSGAQIVGARTAGRGTIQTTPQRLPDGSAVTVTSARLWTVQNGQDVTFDGTGITPDVEMTTENVTELMLLNPTPQMDPMTIRAFQVLYTMVREAGEDPGPPINITDPDASSSGSDSSGSGGSSDASGDDSSTGGDDSSMDTSDVSDSSDVSGDTPDGSGTTAG